MEEIRQRKSVKNDRMAKNNVQSRKMQPSKSQKKFYILTFLVFLGCFYGFIYSGLNNETYQHVKGIIDRMALGLGFVKSFHAVIIDAGSTGSRVLAFTFHKALDNSLKLDKELFAQVKPGLSSFAENPEKAAEKINQLIELAKIEIPESKWKETPLSLKATAGLRLLPEKQAQSLLSEVDKLFKNSPFLTNENSVSIMDGVDEGIFSWFTVNFLLDRLSGKEINTVAALDLGGGSTQITFAPNPTTLGQYEAKYLHDISAFHHKLQIYTNSYLGLGLMAARKGILSKGNDEKSTILRSECINPIINTKWTYDSKTYTVMGPEKPEYMTVKQYVNTPGEKKPVVRFQECLQIIKSYVNSKVDKPKELNDKEINAFSYYFDRAAESGLIDPYNGGTVKIKDFYNKANSVCLTPNTEQPFMCLDLSFITILLQDGFGLNPSTQINLYKKIDDHEISWALGSAFHILENGL